MRHSTSVGVPSQSSRPPQTVAGSDDTTAATATDSLPVLPCLSAHQSILFADTITRNSPVTDVMRPFLALAKMAPCHALPQIPEQWPNHSPTARDAARRHTAPSLSLDTHVAVQQQFNGANPRQAHFQRFPPFTHRNEGGSDKTNQVAWWCRFKSPQRSRLVSLEVQAFRFWGL